MPELPEVQTIINTLLDTSMINKKIIKTCVYTRKLLKNSRYKQFEKFLVNEVVKNIQRKGKYLIFILSHDKYLVVHLRMEGKVFYEENKYTISKNHLRLEIYFNNNHVLRYYDSRMFGTFHIYSKQELTKAPHLTKLALDPLDSSFDENYLKNSLSGVNKYIKTALLDQTLVSGIGNIYADEILFACDILPNRKVSSLNNQDYKNIVVHSRRILKDAIAHGGTTISSYKSDKNHSGKYQDLLRVHGRAGCKCFKCGSIIKKTKINGRGTYFCAKCQK